MVTLNSDRFSDVEIVDDGRDYSENGILNPYTGVLDMPVKYPCIDLVSTSDEEEQTGGARTKKKRVWRKADKHEWLKIYRDFMQDRSKLQPEPLDAQGQLNKNIPTGRNGLTSSGRQGGNLKQGSPDDVTGKLEFDSLESVKTVKDLRRFSKRRRVRRHRTEDSESDSPENLDGSLQEHSTFGHDPGNAEQSGVEKDSSSDYYNKGMVRDVGKTETRLNEDLLELVPDTDEAVYLDLTNSEEEESDPHIKAEAEEGSDIEVHEDIEYKMEDFFKYDRAKTDSKKMKFRNLKYNSLKLLSYSNICLFKWTKYYFVCYHCLEWFKHMQKLRKHVEESHTPEQITSKIVKEIHRYYKADLTDLKCRICSINLNNLAELENHLKRHGIKFKPGGSSLIPYKLCSGTFVCQMCGVQFETRYRLQRHVDGHFLNYVCSVCKAGFSNSGTLKRHCQTHSKKEINYPRNAESLKLKTHRVARGEVRCPQKFKRDDKKLQHMVEEQDAESKVFQCEFCPKVFMTIHWLTKHKNCTHQDELYC